VNVKSIDGIVWAFVLIEYNLRLFRKEEGLENCGWG